MSSRTPSRTSSSASILDMMVGRRRKCRCCGVAVASVRGACVWFVVWGVVYGCRGGREESCLLVLALALVFDLGAKTQREHIV